MVKIASRPFKRHDLAFFQEIISDSAKWQKRELRNQALEEYMRVYEELSGEWRVWMEKDLPVSISYHVPVAPSNQKPWLGTILVKASERRRGVSATIINHLSEELKAAGHKALFAGVPIDEYEWANFLTDCGFEQFKTEENKGETFMIMVRPFE